MGGKQKSKHGKSRRRDANGETTGRSHWLKTNLSEDFESLSLDYDTPPRSSRRASHHSAPRVRTEPSPSSRLTVDELEQADRKRLARARAAGYTPIAETVDRHRCYMEAVQLPSAEVHNLVNLYSELRSESSAPRHRPTILREDFCGTAILCREWCKGSVEHEAWGVDLDPNVIKYAKERTLGSDGGPESERVNVVVGNVLSDRNTLSVPKVDIIAGLNYGINYFKKRPDLMVYLRNCREGLADGGTLIVDLFGGATVSSTGGRLFERRYSDFTYYFEQKPYDALTNTSKVHLHFRFDDGSWLKNAWTYDFRAYTIIEIREAMMEAGFRSTHVWIAASTEEKEARADAGKDDMATDDEVTDEQEENDDSDISDEEPGHRYTNKRSSTRRGSGTEGAYSYERVDGTLEQLQSWNAYVVGIV
ncbi:hypothetical protein SpCBS45565_g02601 [Spizellomyces sp. 'palustris']|nr:hypothetical protein SpCBS45565_g02601 [Spizellomyces sp. 'palustris']